MSKRVIRPECGHSNSRHRVTCKRCRVNLAQAISQSATAESSPPPDMYLEEEGAAAWEPNDLEAEPEEAWEYEEPAPKDLAEIPDQTSGFAFVVGAIGLLLGLFGLRGLLGDANTAALYTQCPLAIVLCLVAWGLLRARGE